MLLARMTFLRFCLLVAVSMISARSSAQTSPPETPLKEVQLAANSFSRVPAPDWVEPIDLPPATDKLPVVNRLYDAQYMVAETVTNFFRQAIQINDTASLTNAGQISIQFVPEYQRLALHKVVIHRGSEVIDLTASSAMRFLQREAGLERGAYSDVATASLLVSDLRVGDTLETSYSIEGTNPVFGKTYFDYASWDRMDLTLRRRVILKHPLDRKINWRFVTAKKDDALSPQVTTAGDLRRVEFNGTQIQAITPEPLTPADSITYRWIEFSEFQDWGAVAAWAQELFDPVKTESTEFRALVAGINAKDKPEERVVAALEVVQTQVRYFSIALGENSHKPAQPDIVLQRRFGDCKDKTLLLIALLKEAGIKSNPVLLSVVRQKGLDKSLPSPLNFDHAIVEAVIGGQQFYLDPTRLGQHGRLDRLGKVFPGAQVLVVASNTKSLTEIRATAPFDRSDLIETASLPKLDGQGTLEVRRVWTGVNAEAMRVWREQITPDVLNKSFLDAITQRFPAATMTGDLQFVDDKVNNVLALTANYAVPKMASERSGNWLIPINAANFKGTLAPISPTTRTTPMSIPGYPFNGQYSFKITLPAGIDVWETPINTNLKNKYFATQLEMKYRGNVVKVTMSLETRSDRVEPADLKNYNDAMESLVKLPVAAIFIPEKVAKAERSKRNSRTAATTPPAETQLEANLRLTIKNASAAISSGHLAPADAAQAYIMRANAEGDLGEVENAVADANKAVELSNGDKIALLCRGSAYLVAGEFDKSVTDYTTALTQGADAGEVYRMRGIAKFYAARLGEAADDFAKSSELTSGDAQVYGDIWLAAASRKQGKEIPAEVTARSATAIHLEWPRPALALLTGTASDDEILKAIHSKNGLEKVTVATEGYFYLGLSRLLNNDPSKARDYFAKSVASKAYSYEEYKTAQFELKKLSSPTGTSSINAKPDSPGASNETGTEKVDYAPATPPSAKAPNAAKNARKKPAQSIEHAAPDVWGARPFQ